MLPMKKQKKLSEGSDFSGYETRSESFVGKIKKKKTHWAMEKKRGKQRSVEINTLLLSIIYFCLFIFILCLVSI